MDTDIREKYSFLIIEYLKEGSYCINERDDSYEVDIASSGDGTVIAYDGNEYDVTESFRALNISIDKAAKDNFIVLHKNRKED